jgi:glycosyltransferase involved in cell wall biosynthesis
VVTVAVIPALDEQEAIGAVVREALPHVASVVVVDNGSRDATPQRAADAGADVVREAKRGYGAACLAGVRRARELGADVVLFLDGDGSDDLRETPRLLAPIAAGEADLVLGARTRVVPGAMAPVQRFGNWLAPLLMRLLVGARYRDMPPFKAVTMPALDALALTDDGMGYIIQMLLRAHAQRLRVVEIDVAHRPRVTGRSKVSGTVSGTIRASAKITSAIARHALLQRRAKNP